MVMRLALAAHRSATEAATTRAQLDESMVTQQRLEFRVAKAEEFLERTAADAEFTKHSMRVRGSASGLMHT
jgi:hypothetical protein